MAKIRITERLFAPLKAIGPVRIGVVAILALVGASCSFALAVSGIARHKNPQAALIFMPNESAALAARADQLFFANPEKPPSQVRTLALKALRQQALNPKAQRLLGYYADAKGQSVAAETFVRSAAKLSRQEPGAQLWLIEAEARKGNATQALVHYDILLRTKPETRQVLFPRLTNAIDEQEIREALKPYIRGKNQWAYDFLLFATSKSRNLPAVVDLVIETGGLTDQKAAQNQQQVLLERLVSEKYYSDARRLFLQIPGVKPIRLTSPALDAADRDSRFGPMGWQFVNDPDAGAGLLGKAGAGKPSLTVYANAETTRMVANKLLYLTPGRYRLAADLSALERGNTGFLRWQMRCVDAEADQQIGAFDSVGTRVSVVFAIPANCPQQFLELIASGGTGQSGLEATIASIALLSDAN
jgi:hypothetical protein